MRITLIVLSAVGLVVLLYDHALTFVDEVKLIWAAPASFPKYAFLFNRYLVLGCMLGVAYGEWTPSYADRKLY